MSSNFDFHADRARAELDCVLAAADNESEARHLELARLHLVHSQNARMLEQLNRNAPRAAQAFGTDKEA